MEKRSKASRSKSRTHPATVTLIESFIRRRAVAARMQLSNAPPPSIGSSSAAKSAVPKKDPKAPVIVKKDLKKLSLKGVVVKKKKIASAGKTDVPVIVEAAKTVRSWDTDPNSDDGPSTKKRRISESSES